MKTNRYLICLSLSLAFALVGCDEVPDEQWVKTLPGVYQGSKSNFVERVELKPDGSALHTVTHDGKPLVSESGKWSFRNGAVLMEPFTLIVEPLSQQLTTNVAHVAIGQLFVMRDGKAAQKMTPAAEWWYVLLKQPTNDANPSP